VHVKASADKTVNGSISREVALPWRNAVKLENSRSGSRGGKLGSPSPRNPLLPAASPFDEAVPEKVQQRVRVRLRDVRICGQITHHTETSARIAALAPTMLKKMLKWICSRRSYIGISIEIKSGVEARQFYVGQTRAISPFAEIFENGA
jgi:hypothetical protein